MIFGRACKARVLHLSGVGGHLENAKYNLKCQHSKILKEGWELQKLLINLVSILKDLDSAQLEY